MTGITLKRPQIPKLAAIIILAVIPLLGWMGVAQAHSFRTGDSTSVPAGETVHNTLFISGQAIDIAGNVDGDVFCAGQNVTISGDVTGDVICAGQSVRISGNVDGDIRLAGQDIILSGTVSRNASLIGQTVTMDADSTIGGDVSIAGQTAVLNGQIGRDVAATVTNMTINGQVKRDVQAVAEQLKLGGGAAINGKIDYTSHSELSKAGGASVVGKVTRSEPPQEAKRSWTDGLWFALWVVASMLLLALALVLLVPRLFQKASDRAMGHMGKTLLAGLVSSIVVPIVIVLLFATVVGIPLAILALLSWLMALIVAGPFAAYLLGRYLLRGRSNTPVWTILAGGAVLLALYFVPFIGWLIALVALWFGLGMVLLGLWRWLRKDHRVIEPRTKESAVK